MEISTSQKIRNSLIQLIVGLILIGFASWYLGNHPAELQSIRSSISTARQKVQTWLGGSRGIDETAVSNQQIQARSQLLEIISAIQECSPDTPVGEYQSLYQDLDTSSTQNFARNGVQYYEKISEAYTAMQQLCDNEQSTLD